MREYEIKFNKKDGWSYEKGEIPIESSYVELSDDEVQILVNLMKEKGTYDVSELNIEESHPDIYNKLVETCDSVAWDVALAEAAREAHYYDDDETFLDELQEYCESEYNYDETKENFCTWLDTLIESWSSSQICDLYEEAGIELCWDIINFNGIETYDYKVTLPQSIVSMVFNV